MNRPDTIAKLKQPLKLFAIGLVLVTFLLIHQASWAIDNNAETPLLLALSSEQSRNNISQAEAAKIANKTHNGKVLGIRQSNGAYSVRVLLPSGVIKNIKVDANNGKITR